MDAIRKLEEVEYRASKLGNRLVVKGPTWKIRKDSRIDDYLASFATDPSGTMCDIGAVPSLTIEPYFEDFNRIMKCINPEMLNPIPLVDEGKKDLTPDSPLQQFRRMNNNFIGHGHKYYIHVDLATGGEKGTGCTCGFCMAHKQGDKYILDLVTRFVGGGGDKEINFSEVREFIFNLRDLRGFTIKKVTFDGWQSIDSIQILKRKGYRSEKLSVQMEEYDSLKDAIYSGSLEMYNHPILLREWKGIKRHRNTKIASDFFKDMSDSVAGVVTSLSEDAPRREASMAPQKTEGATIPRYQHNRNVKDSYRQRIKDMAGIN